MKEEKLKILKMIESKKISAEEGLELLNSLENVEEKTKLSRWLRVKIWESENGEEVDLDSKPKVNVNIPLALAKTALKFIPQNAKNKISEKIKERGNIDMNLEDLPLEDLLDEIKQFGSFTLVEIDDKDTKVRVVFE